jgi:hypothetical protein
MGSSFKRNRIINGDMRVDQRNAGASGTALSYMVDRWAYGATQSSKGTWQQNAGSVTPPAGFTNYLGFTSSSSYSVLTGDTFYFTQPIEGLNVSDLAYGTASARTVTLSFWVRSTGLSYPATFGGSINNPAATKSYLFSYSIPSSGAWTYVSVPITGDTASVMNTTTAIGLNVWLAMGSGSTYTSATTGSWIAGTFVQPSGTASIVGNNGATFYITGVQLEVGSVATPYERQIYSDQLAQCQRYLPAYNSASTVYGFAPAYTSSTTSVTVTCVFPVLARTAPTGITVSSATHITLASAAGSFAFSAATVGSASSVTTGFVTGTVSGATAGQGGAVYFNNASGQLLFTGCEL